MHVLEIGSATSTHFDAFGSFQLEEAFDGVGERSWFIGGDTEAGSGDRDRIVTRVPVKNNRPGCRKVVSYFVETYPKIIERNVAKPVDKGVCFGHG